MFQGRLLALLQDQVSKQRAVYIYILNIYKTPYPPTLPGARGSAQGKKGLSPPPPPPQQQQQEQQQEQEQQQQQQQPKNN